MQLYFVRHGQSENNRRWALTGSHIGRSEDPALTDVGQQQAAKLAEFLSHPGIPAGNPQYDLQNVGGFPLTHLYCSLMVRAIETGLAVAQTLDLPLISWADAHEVGGIHQTCDEGEHRGLPGKNRAELEALYPDLILPETLGDEGWWNRPYEDLPQRAERAERFVETLLQRHGGTDDRVAVVSHGGFYNHVLQSMFCWPQENQYWFTLNNVGITRIDFAQDMMWLCYANRVDFLSRELIT